jgi:hypothetical protein
MQVSACPRRSGSPHPVGKIKSVVRFEVCVTGSVSVTLQKFVKK